VSFSFAISTAAHLGSP